MNSVIHSFPARAVIRDIPWSSDEAAAHFMCERGATAGRLPQGAAIFSHIFPAGDTSDKEHYVRTPATSTAYLLQDRGKCSQKPGEKEDARPPFFLHYVLRVRVQVGGGVRAVVMYK